MCKILTHAEFKKYDMKKEELVKAIGGNKLLVICEYKEENKITSSNKMCNSYCYICQTYCYQTDNHPGDCFCYCTDPRASLRASK